MILIYSKYRILAFLTCSWKWQRSLEVFIVMCILCVCYDRPFARLRRKPHEPNSNDLVQVSVCHQNTIEDAPSGKCWVSNPFGLHSSFFFVERKNWSKPQPDLLNPTLHPKPLSIPIEAPLRHHDAGKRPVTTRAAFRSDRLATPRDQG